MAGRARNALRHRRARFMFIAGRVFLFVVEYDLEPRAIVITREQFALVADDEAPAGREFPSLRDNFLDQVRAGPQGRDEVAGLEHAVFRIRIAVIPPELARRQTLTFREIEANPRGERKRLGIDAGRELEFDRGRVSKF